MQNDDMAGRIMAHAFNGELEKIAGIMRTGDELIDGAARRVGWNATRKRHQSAAVESAKATARHARKRGRAIDPEVSAYLKSQNVTDY